MFAIVFLPMVLLWGADNHEFFERLTDAEWDYVGAVERRPGPQPDGAYALTLESGGEAFIVFKQRPLAGPPDRDRARAVAATAD